MNDHKDRLVNQLVSDLHTQSGISLDDATNFVVEAVDELLDNLILDATQTDDCGKAQAALKEFHEICNDLKFEGQARDHAEYRLVHEKTTDRPTIRHELPEGFNTKSVDQLRNDAQTGPIDKILAWLGIRINHHGSAGGGQRSSLNTSSAANENAEHGSNGAKRVKYVVPHTRKPTPGGPLLGGNDNHALESSDRNRTSSDVRTQNTDPQFLDNDEKYHVATLSQVTGITKSEAYNALKSTGALNLKTRERQDSASSESTKTEDLYKDPLASEVGTQTVVRKDSQSGRRSETENDDNITSRYVEASVTHRDSLATQSTNPL